MNDLNNDWSKPEEQQTMLNNAAGFVPQEVQELHGTVGIADAGNENNSATAALVQIQQSIEATVAGSEGVLFSLKAHSNAASSGSYNKARSNKVKHKQQPSDKGKKEGKNKFNSTSSSQAKLKKKPSVALKDSAFFIKKVARLPLKDRKEILKVLKKKECKRSVLATTSKVMAKSLSYSSNSSVNKD